MGQKKQFKRLAHALFHQPILLYILLLMLKNKKAHADWLPQKIKQTFNSIGKSALLAEEKLLSCLAGKS
ncbi:MAG: hypothetical protein N3G80_00890 [Candidatus Micrarchaeota archaeon]|nr:hypothetical protein [Candidatus Micrarchaeota archaeon]